MLPPPTPRFTATHDASSLHRERRTTDEILSAAAAARGASEGPPRGEPARRSFASPVGGGEGADGDAALTERLNAVRARFVAVRASH